MREDRYRQQRNWGARILEYEHKGMRVVFLENEKLRVGVLVDKGTDVIEFNHKPTDTDFVWLAPGGVRNPASYLSTAQDPLAPFLEYTEDEIVSTDIFCSRSRCACAREIAVYGSRRRSRTRARSTCAPCGDTT